MHVEFYEKSVDMSPCFSKKIKKSHVFKAQWTSTRCLGKKVGYLYFYNFGNSGPIFTFFFTVKFRKDLRRKLELNLPPLL